jgi:hypothetical protein
VGHINVIRRWEGWACHHTYLTFAL